MDTWKENGVVPDSDEEAGSDSQSTVSWDFTEDLTVRSNNEKRHKTGNRWQERDGQDNKPSQIRPLRSGSRLNENDSGDKPSPTSKSGPCPDEIVQIRTPQGSNQFMAPAEQVELDTSRHIDPEDLPYESRRQSNFILEHTPPPGGQPLEDEISKSYVLMSSPLSSLSSLSSRDSNLKAPWETGGDSQISDCLEGGASCGSSSILNYDTDIGIVEEESSHEPSNRRYLRQRNPIQIHPYALEGEKYRQSLIARGLKPVKIASVQKQLKILATTEDSQDTEFNAEKNPIPTLEESAQSSPSESHNQSHASQEPFVNPFRNISFQDDEDFPDIGVLVDRQKSDFVRHVQKRRKLSRGPVASMHMDTRPPTNPPTARHTIIMNDDIFDIPPSPPATSPLLKNFSPGVSAQLPSSLSPIMKSMSTLEGNISRRFSTEAGLPTPVTSTVKNTVDLTTMEDSDNIEDPLISDAEFERVSVSSGPDESAQIRRVGKKIRGVLPASWLRLDQHAKNAGRTKPVSPGGSSLSPVKVVRRGVATAILPVASDGPKAIGERLDPFFLSEESDDDEQTPLRDAIGRSERELEPLNLFSQSEMSFMVEDDRVDPMLPPRKRQAKLLPSNYRRKSRAINSLFRKNLGGSLRQPKITDKLVTPSRSHGVPCAKNKAGQRVRRAQVNRDLGSPKLEPPNLSILDFIGPSERPTDRLPQFVRIAARTARARRGLGRGSPTRKFIKLANRKDTEDAQAVLHDWREGSLRPREIYADREPGLQKSNQEDDSKSPIHRQSGRVLTSRGTSIRSNLPSQITVSMMEKPRVGCIEEIDRYSQKRDTNPIFQPLAPIELNLVSKRKLSRPKQTYHIRPAQLETLEVEHDYHHPGAAFAARKKILDALYRMTRKVSKGIADAPLSRFLYDPDSVLHDSIAASDVGPAFGTKSPDISTSIQKLRLLRSRKRRPRRIDAGAAHYRQPSEPLILELLRTPPEPQESRQHSGKLLGLGGFGTQYTHHFDVFPFQQDVYFHESTFVGSGRLAQVLNVRSNNYFQSGRGHATFQLGQKQICWGLWNDDVSSEIGLCYDWVSDHLQQSISAGGNRPVGGQVLECLSFISDYVQNHLSLPDLEAAQDCLARFTEVSQGLNENLERYSNGCAPGSAANEQVAKASLLNTILLFQFLQVSAVVSHGSAMNLVLEAAFQTSSAASARFLLLFGLECVRQLYDDLQYLAVREAGIKRDRHVAEGWVTLIHLVQAAHIPRFSFWSTINSTLLSTNTTGEVDARQLEKSWYSLFSLLPLFQFDQNGAIRSNGKHMIGVENWSLIQRLLKRVFELYLANSRQSPSFNDYCRALFTRVYHLAHEWGWRQCVTIIGTLFDFFALQKLEHLRNEEAHQSPRFLQQLHVDQELQIEPEDRCFHIFLKVIASAISKMREDGDLKNIRNLVIRLLPNHDRQYPKEEEVQERHLASLRNHHDLLCTLFWAAPVDLRPSINLISELVNVATSHKEAIFISLRSWTSLSHFVLSSTPTQKAYDPLSIWQQSSVEQLISQYHSAEADIEDQFRRMPGPQKDLISAQRILHTVKCNRNEIVDVIRAQVAAVISLMQDATTMDGVQLAFAGRGDTEALMGLLRQFDGSDQLTIPVIEKLLEATQMYLRKLNLLTPAISPKVDSAPETEEDSQEYGGDLIEEFTRWQYVEILNGQLLASLRDMIRKCVCCATSNKRLFMEKLIKTYALVAGTLVKSKHREYYEFTSPTGKFAAITIGSPEVVSREYAPLFLAELLETINFLPDSDELSTYNTISDWLFLLVKPHELLRYDHRYTYILSKLGLLSPIEDTPPVTSFQSITLSDMQTHRHNLVVGAFRKMHTVLTNDELLIKFYPTASAAQMRTRFGAIASRLMKTMDTDISSMENGSTKQTVHKSFASYVALDIKVYFPHEYPFDRFLSSTIGMTTHTDPENFISTLRSYGLRLQTDRGKREFNHLIIGAFKTAAVDKSLPLIPKSLVTAMSCNALHGNEWIDLASRLLGYVTPACIHVAYETPSGWLIAEPLLATAAIQLAWIAQSENATCAVEIARTILRSIVDSIRHLAGKYDMDDQLSVPHEDIHALILVTRFINSTLQWLLHLAAQLEGALNEEVQEIFNVFGQFAKCAQRYIESPVTVFIEHWEEHQQRDLLGFRHAAATDSSHNTRDYLTLDPERIDLLLTAVDEYVTACRLANLDVITFHGRYGDLAPKIMLLANVIATKGPAYNVLQPQFSNIKRGIRPNGGLLFLGIQPSSPGNRPGKVQPVSEFVNLLLNEIKTNWDFHESTGSIAIRIGQSYHQAGQVEHTERNRRRLFDVLMNEIQFFLREYERQTGYEKGAMKRVSADFVLGEELWI